MDVAIVGAGQVGSAAAFALRLKGEAARIILVDVNGDRSRAEALDIAHATPEGNGHAIIAGDYAAIAGAGVVVLTAGANQRPGQTRLDLLATNAKICAEIVPQVLRHAPDALILVATNPVDVLTELVLNLSHLPPQRVLGTGTLLDSFRLRIELARYWDVSPASIQAVVVGEHGDGAVPVWSRVTVGAIPAADHGRVTGKPLTDEIKQSIRKAVVGSAATIIQGKGATNYGIGGAIAHICHTIAIDGQEVLPLSHHHEARGEVKNFCLSSPVILGRSGILRCLDLPMDSEEEEAFGRGARMLAGMADEGRTLLGI
ncbi:MAG: hypothetical protein LBP65_00755 [Puniceicoccales bacterium]|jgi:L-lactate dehydrogenase|nr:hypothetical protein [Puniceicoccales bacterium]